jgi:hypothetical protein
MLKSIEALLELINKYNVLFLAIAGFFAYWIKRHYDYKSKNNETRFNLYYQNKINSIREFFSSYIQFEMTFNSSYYLLYQDQPKGKEFDAVFIPSRDKLFSAFSHVQLFINEKHLEPYKNIIDRSVEMINEVIKISHNVSTTHTDLDVRTNPITKSNRAYSITVKTSNENKLDLQKIATQTRIDFKIK